MEMLITPARVAELAFRAPAFIDPAAIPESTIVAAQHRFIRPVFGPLYDRMCEGAYPELLEEYIVPPLALYVRMLMMPSLAVQAGTAGVVEVNSRNLARAGDTQFRYAVRRLRSDASALIDRAVTYVESHPAQFPEYDRCDNIRHRCRIDGNIVL